MLAKFRVTDLTGANVVSWQGVVTALTDIEVVVEPVQDHHPIAHLVLRFAVSKVVVARNDVGSRRLADFAYATTVLVP